MILLVRGAEELAVTLAALPGNGHRCVAMDVSDLDAWERFIAGIDRLDGLVTAAGVLGPVGPIDEL